MKTNGYYNDAVMNKFRAALHDAIEAVKAGTDTRVRISGGNIKMGDVVSVSMLPFLTCPACCGETCGEKCYAAKLANLRPAVLKAYALNTAMALLRPGEYWQQVRRAVAGARFFRFHVSGDITSAAYFANMVSTAIDNPHCEILCFTKRYNVVNDWIAANGELPGNLHVLLSGWTNLDPENPHNLPETNVIPKGGAAGDGWKLCGGNCFDCAVAGAGCWRAVKGDVIAFNMH